ncbi:hypothetical protein P43SY_010174 [Pythium insidiosum]|uniref:Uncharacterized protein n=1 Tax=Pythium insidiosum TaxID=114742 RepID=A0AAD5MH64_PYTIN|nr:hypothetical protein P43SY_010174 [Pythium insidiosum]
MSAKPAGRPSSAAHASSMHPRGAPGWELDDGDDDLQDVIQDDDDEDPEDGEFGDDAEAMERLLRQQRLMDEDGDAAIFRPTSAPVSRSKLQPVGEQAGLQRQDAQRHRAAVSIAYLKQAAEKKKKRDRAFAQELLREESDYKKKIQLKIDQANKMTAAMGTQRSFGVAPDRDGLHMVRVIDPASNDRVISFERLASVQIGHLASTAAHRRDSVSAALPPNNASSSLGHHTAAAHGTGTHLPTARDAKPTSKLRIHGIRTSRPEPTAGDVAADTAALAREATRKRPTAKATDRTLVQEELKSVLASTIDLTKVLQDQLHELKLKGWNFSSRTALPGNTQSS